MLRAQSLSHSRGILLSLRVKDLLVPMRRIHNRIHRRIIYATHQPPPTIIPFTSHVDRITEQKTEFWSRAGGGGGGGRTEISTHIRRHQHLDRQILVHLPNDLDCVSGLEMRILFLARARAVVS